MIIMGADVETTGLDVDQDEVVETGFVVYETSEDQVLALHSDLYKTKKWSEEAEAIHNIKRPSSNLGYDSEFNPWTLVSQYKPEIVVAHNAEYDKGFIAKRWPEFKELPWVCTDKDLPHNQKVRKVSSTRLSHLAVDYGLSVCGSLHRALFDALLCCQIAARHDLKQALLTANEPKFIVQCWHEGRPDFQSPSFNRHKEYLKKAGFRWDGNRWIRSSVPESKVQPLLKIATATPGWQAVHTPI